MKITAYPLYGPAAALQPPPAGRGWDFLCPCAFAATWNGGPGAGDVEISLAERATGQVGFVQSLQGEGLLTFYPGYQCKTEAEHALWVRGRSTRPRTAPSRWSRRSTLPSSRAPSPFIGG